MSFGIVLLNDIGEEINSFAVSFIIDFLRPGNNSGSKSYAIPDGSVIKIVNYANDTRFFSVSGNTVSWQAMTHNGPDNYSIGAIITVVRK
ncbi:hypothetical protein [Vibrio phage vB_VibM_83AMN]|nr:hypothetical protein [Vibrio phage vB_VibM_83AMN]